MSQSLKDEEKKQPYTCASISTEEKKKQFQLHN